MAGSLLRIEDDSRQTAVQRPLLLRPEHRLDGRLEQRVREPEAVSAELEHARQDRCVDRPGLSRRAHARKRRIGEGGDDAQQPAYRLRQALEPLTNEPEERVRNRKLAFGVGPFCTLGQRATQLERVEGVTSGGLVDALEDGVRKGRPESILEELVQSRRSQRPDAPPLQPVVQPPLERRDDRRAACAGPMRREHRHGSVAEAPDPECKRFRRWLVRPLHVVEGDDDRPALGQRPQYAQSRSCDRALVRPIVVRACEQEGDGKRPSLRIGQVFSDLVHDAPQQVTERRERELRLVVRGSGDEHAKSPCARILDAMPPEDRLPDPSLALEHKRARLTAADSVEEGLDRAQLGLAAERERRLLPQPCAAIAAPGIACQWIAPNSAGREPSCEGCGLGHYFHSFATVARESLPFQDLLEGTDRDLELLEARLARRQPL